MSKFFNNNKILSLALTSTLVFILYTALILSRVSGCFTLEVGSNSLGLSFSYNIDLVQTFFDSRSKEQLLCYGEFLICHGEFSICHGEFLSGPKTVDFRRDSSTFCNFTCVFSWEVLKCTISTVHFMVCFGHLPKTVSIL